MEKLPHDLAQMRKTYEMARLDESCALAEPLEQFHHWLDEALKAQALEPNAMTLATVGADGRPSTRILLLKGSDAQGLVFFTNYDSRKGRDLATNPHAAMQFYWPELERVVRAEGPVSKVSAAESDAYYASRPLGSRIGAWASHQSQPLPNREQLEQAWAREEGRWGDAPPRPEQWGGYRLQPLRWEFWQGRPSRLHDRLCYEREGGQGAWQLSRLAP